MSEVIVPHPVARRSNRSRGTAFLALLLLAGALSPATAIAQDPAAPPPPAQPGALPRVFLDCQGGASCDENHFRTEIQFVNWAQDREDSDVHVIATSQQVGGGGSRIKLDFIGRGRMAAIVDSLSYTSSGSDVFAETRDGVTHILSLGLLRYAIASGLATSFELDFEAPGSGDGDELLVPGAGIRDPWDYWTFQVELSGDVDWRETSTNVEINPSISADRVTEDWKMGFEASINAERNRRELSGGREVRDDRDEWEVEGIVVRSISNHLSAGLDFGGGSSVSENQHARIEIEPAIEYNYYPYSISNRRQLTVQYSVGGEYSNYREETIFNVTSELRPQHELSARYNAREGWGNAGVGASYTQYLHDLGLYRASVNGNINYRITRGLDLNLSGSSSWVNNEIHIPLSDISDEDILLGRQNLPSSYRYTARVGLSYRWGSPFTNIVNTRFSGGGGGGDFD